MSPRSAQSRVEVTLGAVATAVVLVGLGGMVVGEMEAGAAIVGMEAAGATAGFRVETVADAARERRTRRTSPRTGERIQTRVMRNGRLPTPLLLCMLLRIRSCKTFLNPRLRTRVNLHMQLIMILPWR